MTNSNPFHMIPQAELKAGGVFVTGVILCSHCRKKMDGVCKCGNYKCLVCVYWNGKHYEIRKDNEGDSLTYEKAVKRLIKISDAIANKTFNPIAYSDSNIAERRFENQVKKWFLEKEKQAEIGELSPGTTGQYRGFITNYFCFFDSLDVRDIDLEQLSKFKDTLDRVSIKTRKNIMVALHGFFGWLLERGTIQKIPVFPKIKGDDSKATRAIDMKAQNRALQHLPEHHRTIYEFLMETGLRPGEVCALLVEHIDINQEIARIDRTFSGSKLRETTKQKRKRIIPLSEKALQIVQQNIQGKLPKQYLFINPFGGNHYTVNRLERIWNKYSMTGLTLYECTRHSFATQMIQNNDVSVVKELMGHSDIRTTQKYLHFQMGKLSKAVNSRGVIKIKNRSEIEASFSDGK